MTVSGKLNASEEIVPIIITLIGDPPDDEPTLFDDEPVLFDGEAVLFDDEDDLEDELQAARPTASVSVSATPPRVTTRFALVGLIMSPCSLVVGCLHLWLVAVRQSRCGAQIVCLDGGDVADQLG